MHYCSVYIHNLKMDIPPLVMQENLVIVYFHSDILNENSIE